jgi:hypothetical protein
MAKRVIKKFNISELMPSDYMALSNEEKEFVVHEMSKMFVIQFGDAFGQEVATVEVITKILHDTIKKNEEIENYEVCSLLKSMLEYINE